jgi:type IV pilus assembly protein PilB
MRLKDMGVDPFLINSALHLILAQRLVRKICSHCREKVKVSPQAILEAGLDPATLDGQVFYEGKGCLECDGTGFHGRMAIAELLDLSDRIRGLILERRPAAEIKKAAKEEGMTFLREAALAKVFEGSTTLKDINKVTFVD